MENRVDHANPFTNQVFQEAVVRSDMAIVKLLLKYGIYPKRSERNRQGLTALQQCVLDGNGRMAILLLEAGADIEAKTSNGWTCLHIASALGDLDILTTLINHCSDLVALTKNEELPIDLAASRDIKIKLAKEMSRIGYSELAQWYMRKLVAREGVFYVLSADTLLDLACDDKQERSYTNDYLYYVRQCNNQRDMFIHSPIRKDQNLRHALDGIDGINSPKRDMWFEYSSQDKMTYLTCSSGYLSEVVFDPSSGQYSKASTNSPQRKVMETGSADDRTSRSLVSISEDGEILDDCKVRYGSLKRTSSNRRYSQSMSRKPSTIELHIDYTHTTESESDEESEETGDSFDNVTETTTVSQATENTTVDEVENLQAECTENTQVNNEDGIHIPPEEVVRIANEMHSQNENKNRNVRFNAIDTSNEFCNCPNCKKLGYAFSPDIQSANRKAFHVPKAHGLIPQSNFNRFYYPETTDKHAIYFDEDYRSKQPRKRKKKLFSGIKSMFKDSIKVRTNMDTAPHAVDDAGILFSVSLRDKNKAKAIKQRNNVRRSNSFSGVQNKYHEDEVNVLPHSHVIPPSNVVPPPPSFSDAYLKKQTNGSYYPNNIQMLPLQYATNGLQYIIDEPRSQDCQGYQARTFNTAETCRDKHEAEHYGGVNATTYYDTTTTLPHGFHYTGQNAYKHNRHSYAQNPNELCYDNQIVTGDAHINAMMISQNDRIQHEAEKSDSCIYCDPNKAAPEAIE